MKSFALLLALCTAALAMETNASLPGTSWTVVELDGTALKAEKLPTIEFDKGGNISGDASCNRYGGSCTIEGNTIAVSRQRVTLRMCDDETMKRERQFLRILQAAQTWEITGQGELILNGSEGRLKAIRQTPAPADNAR